MLLTADVGGRFPVAVENFYVAGRAGISPETDEKVHKAAKELGCRVGYLPRSLVDRRANGAGMDNPFCSQQVHEVAEALVDRNCPAIRSAAICLYERAFRAAASQRTSRKRLVIETMDT